MSSADKNDKPKKKRGSIAALKMDRRLMRAMTHPIRIQVLSEINKPGVQLSPVRFAENAALPLQNVHYHFKELEKFGCIEIAEEIPRRGAVEHVYRASRRVLFDSEEWAELPAIFKAGTAGQALTDYLLAAREAIEEGTFEGRDDSHLTWTTLRLDERGWCEGSSILAEALDKLLALEEEAAPRIAEGAEELDATFGLGLFESPRHDVGGHDNRDWKRKRRRRNAGLDEGGE
jgi:hypothetical protein